MKYSLFASRCSPLANSRSISHASSLPDRRSGGTRLLAFRCSLFATYDPFPMLPVCRIGDPGYTLLTTHYSRLTIHTHHSLFTTHYSRLTIHTHLSPICCIITSDDGAIRSFNQNGATPIAIIPATRMITANRSFQDASLNPLKLSLNGPIAV